MSDEIRDLPDGTIRWDGETLTLNGAPLGPGRYRLPDGPVVDVVDLGPDIELDPDDPKSYVL